MLLIVLAAILILAPLTRSVCERIGIPATVGYIVLGLVTGGTMSGLKLSPEGFDPVISTLAELGIVAFLFRIGLKSHTKALLEKLPRASLIWTGDVLANVLIGYAVARYGFDWSLGTSLVVAAAFSATSVAVSVSVWEDLGRLDSDQGQTLLDVAELDDLSAAILLAMLLGVVSTVLDSSSIRWADAGSALLTTVLRLLVFVAGCYLFAHFVERRFTRFNKRISGAESSLTIAILGAGLAIAAIADVMGFSLAIGAFFAGLAFSRDPDAVRTEGGFTYFYNLLTPFFFINIGLQTDLSVLVSFVGIGLILLPAAVAGKVIGTGLPALRSMGGKAALNFGVSMIPRAELALVVIYAAREIDERLVPPEVFGALVFVSVTTCILSPLLLRRMMDG